MPVFIARDYDNKVVDVVLANTYELANAYWQGKSVIPHHVDIRSDSDLNGHPTGVLPIVSTVERALSSFGSEPRDVRVIV